MDLRISKIGINEARKEKVAYPPLHNCVEKEGRSAGRFRLQRAEAAVHIDVDLLHPLREALELQKETQSPLASKKKTFPRAGFGVSETAVGEEAYREALAAGRGRVEALHRRVRRGRHGRRRGGAAALKEAVAYEGGGRKRNNIRVRGLAARV